MTEENMYLASNIKILREEARLTIAEFAAKANVREDIRTRDNKSER